MADTPSKPAAGGKKLPKWAIPVGIAVAVGLGLLIAKKSKSGEGNATEPGTEGLNNQSFIPVTGENVAGVGASGGFGGESGSSNANLIGELLKEDKESSAEASAENRAFYEKIITNLGSGGGAPSSQAAPGSTVAPPPETQPPNPPVTPTPSPPKPAPAAPKCPSSYPNQNGSPASPSTCYADIRCGNGCAGHRYQNGTKVECQVKNSHGQCVWG